MNEDALARQERDSQQLCREYHDATARVFGLLDAGRPLPHDFPALLVEVGGLFADMSLRNREAGTRLRLAVVQMGTTMTETGREMQDGQDLEEEFLRDAHGAVAEECRSLGLAPSR